MDEKGCKSERDSTWSDEIVNEMAVAWREMHFFLFSIFMKNEKTGKECQNMEFFI